MSIVSLAIPLGLYVGESSSKVAGGWRKSVGISITVSPSIRYSVATVSKVFVDHREATSSVLVPHRDKVANTGLRTRAGEREVARGTGQVSARERTGSRPWSSCRVWEASRA